MKQNLTYGDLYNEETAIDFLLECMLNEVMCDRKSNKNKGPKSVGDDAVNCLVEVSLEEVMESEPVTVDEPIRVGSIEEVMGIESVIVIDEDYDEEEQVSAPKCIDIEKAVSVLDRTCTDMSPDDFEPEVWAEANELYYSMGDVDYTEEKENGVGTVMTYSNNERLGDFLIGRTNSIESWKEEGLIGAENDTEYVYEDDEVNVPETCDETLMGFRKSFWCMGLKAA